MSDPNNGPGGRGPKKRGLVIGAILWALVLVVGFNFLYQQLANAGTQEVPYSEFLEMVENDEVSTVLLKNNQYVFYRTEDVPADGEAPDTDLAKVLEQQMDAAGATRYVTATLTVADPDLVALLREHNVKFYSEMTEESSYFMSLLLSYVVPMVIMVALLLFLMRRLGGAGGLGGVGKSNAKVYMEKSTGVTFADRSEEHTSELQSPWT